MAKQTINLGTVPNDNTGDTLRAALDKVNDNFDEQYSALSGFTSNNVTIANNAFFGNSTVNTVINSTGISFSNVITINSSATSVGSNVVINVTGISVGNSTVNTYANSTYIKSTTANVISNTGLMLGSSTKAANGYTFLPNGVKLVWGWVSANSTVGNATFSSAFTTAVYTVTATSNTTTATYQAGVIGTNTSVAVIRTANATAVNVYWMAIGS